MLAARRLVGWIGLLCLLVGPAHAQDAPLRPESAPYYLLPGQAFEISLQIGDPTTPVTNLLGIAFELLYDPAIVTLSGVAPGTFLDRAGAGLIDYDGDLLTLPGVAPYGLSRTAPSPAVSGNGITAVFQAQVDPNAAPGLYTLTLQDVKAVTDEGLLIPLDIQTGTFEVILPIGHDFLLLANDDIDVDKDAILEGDLHANQMIDLKKDISLTGSLTSSGEIQIDKDTIIDGDATASDAVTLANNVTITGTLTENTNVPVEVLPSFTFTAGSSDVTVSANATTTLAPGSYGAVEVKQGGTLELTAGAYFFEKLTVKKNSILALDVTDGLLEVFTEGTVNLNKDVEMQVTPGGEASSTLVRMNGLADIVVGKNSVLIGAFAAPQGEVHLKTGTALRGSVAAEQIDVKEGAYLVGHFATQTLSQAPASTGSTVASATALAADTLFYWPGDALTLRVDMVGARDLFAVDGSISFAAAQSAYQPGSVAAGALLAGPPVDAEATETAQGVAWSLARTAGTYGASGDGTVAELGFTIPAATTPASITFTLDDVTTTDAEGDTVTLAGGATLVGTIGGVWPGDTDNNCVVEVTDLLPIGLSYRNTGPARPVTDLSWSAQAFSPWGGSSEAANFGDSFVDTNGSGQIDEADVLALGVNFEETRAETTGCAPATVAKGNGEIRYTPAAMTAGTTFTLALEQTTEVADLMGVALKLAIDPAVYAIEAVEAGAFLDNGDLLEIVILQASAGTGEAAFTRKGAGAAASGTGTLALITLTALTDQVSELVLTEVKVSTVTNGIVLAGSEVVLRQASGVANEDGLDLPTSFALHGAYPNPFNPTTTISFDLPETATLRLVVVDLLGRVVATRDLGQQTAGANRQVQFSADGLASGTYLYRLEAIGASASVSQTGRFVLLK